MLFQVSLGMSLFRLGQKEIPEWFTQPAFSSEKDLLMNNLGGTLVFQSSFLSKSIYF